MCSFYSIDCVKISSKAGKLCPALLDFILRVDGEATSASGKTKQHIAALTGGRVCFDYGSTGVKEISSFVRSYSK